VQLRLGTRGSPLALWQAQHVAARLREHWPGLDVPLTIVKTLGEKRPDAPLTSSSSQGVFVREIETALAEGTIDLAVHSLKDLPTATPEGLVLAAIPPRHDARDALVCGKARSIADLAPNAVVATGSPRRRCQLLNARPDLSFVAVRGNVDTRLAKLAAESFDALVLAAAGIERLGLTSAPYTPLPYALCLPAPGQGALALEIRADDSEAARLVRPLDHAPSAAAVSAERAFLGALGAGCLAPAGAYASVNGETLTLDAMVGSLDGARVLRDRIEGASREAAALGSSLAERLLAQGGDALLREARDAEGRDKR